MIKELGSEFEYYPMQSGHGVTFPVAGSFVFSGRTAIEAVVFNLKAQNINSVLLPSYCCDSMIEPFRKNGINFQFYSVKYNKSLVVEINDTADVLLWCNYFGFKNTIPEFHGIIIEDITHSLFSVVNHHEQCDYYIASLRKWGPLVCGGYCSIAELNYVVPSKYFVEKKFSAMQLKSKYLSTDGGKNKQLFLSYFKESNDWLAQNYSERGIDCFSQEYISHINVEKERQIRRRNAHVLYSEIKEKDVFLFSEEEMDCPLFVPIILKNRDKIRRVLIDNKIYCPVHWPHPNAKCDSNLYDLELSLICDQRYSVDDMEKIAEVLNRSL